MKELVSIVLPTYNGSQYIVNMLDSIYNQNYRPLELIISDDCSKDETYQMCLAWIEQKKIINDEMFTVKLIKNKRNIGLSANVSLGVKYINGSYVCLADQDDIWVKGKIEKQVSFLKNNPQDFMCICDRSIIDENNHLLIKSEAKYRNNVFKEYTFRQIVCKPSIYAANAMMFRNQNLNSIFPIPKLMVEHDTYIVLLGSLYGNVGFLPISLVMYRIHRSNLSSSFPEESSINAFICFKKYVKYYERINKVAKYDSLIMGKLLKKKYNISLDQIPNSILNKKKHGIYSSALIATTRSMLFRKLGSFYNK